MDKLDLTQQFSFRLRDAMEAAGWYSLRSTKGVDVQKLADITGHSVQICRKYLRGEAIPEPLKLMQIANSLKVAPGWLLFGDANNDANLEPSDIKISKKSLEYVLTKANVLYNAPNFCNEAPSFIMDLLHDISLMDNDAEQLKRIIDLAFSSVERFYGKK